ncbi:hypothetical protein EB796_015058 [Bugula neritina]|uniref:Uncharacterized protein n=1 Tax=Bugula neritina TaxID=10212 RepID=A0A7J7JLU1_BUGNE|nr:hypothetical protein EB796_015058 [Bugula neritina]
MQSDQPATGPSAPPRLSTAWDNAISVAQANSPRKVAATQPPTDAASAAAAALSKKRAQQRRQNKDDKEAKVLFCLTLNNPLRRFCIRVVEHTYPFTSC